MQLNSVIALAADFRRTACNYVVGKEARLDQSKLSGSNFDHSNFENASFVGVVGSASMIGDGSKYSGQVQLAPASFRHANVKGADFSGAYR